MKRLRHLFPSSNIFWRLLLCYQFRQSILVITFIPAPSVRSLWLCIRYQTLQRRCKVPSFTFQPEDSHSVITKIRTKISQTGPVRLGLLVWTATPRVEIESAAVASDTATNQKSKTKDQKVMERMVVRTHSLVLSLRVQDLQASAKSKSSS